MTWRCSVGLWIVLYVYILMLIGQYYYNTCIWKSSGGEDAHKTQSTAPLNCLNIITLSCIMSTLILEVHFAANTKSEYLGGCTSLKTAHKYKVSFLKRLKKYFPTSVGHCSF